MGGENENKVGGPFGFNEASDSVKAAADAAKAAVDEWRPLVTGILTKILKSLTAVIVVALLAFTATTRAGEVSYQQAYAAAEWGQPLVIVYGAEWCGPCRALRERMKAQPRPYVHVDIDRWEVPLQRYYGGRSVPQIYVLTKTPTGWVGGRER